MRTTPFPPFLSLPSFPASKHSRPKRDEIRRDATELKPHPHTSTTSPYPQVSRLAVRTFPIWEPWILRVVEPAAVAFHSILAGKKEQTKFTQFSKHMWALCEEEEEEEEEEDGSADRSSRRDESDEDSDSLTYKYIHPYWTVEESRVE